MPERTPSRRAPRARSAESPGFRRRSRPTRSVFVLLRHAPGPAEAGHDGRETELTMNDDSQSERTAKRAYQKPELTQVSLKPEEAVLAVCKIAGRSGPAQARCNVPSLCSMSGS